MHTLNLDVALIKVRVNVASGDASTLYQEVDGDVLNLLESVLHVVVGGITGGVEFG
jgi:hypothetical protein